MARSYDTLMKRASEHGIAKSKEEANKSERRFYFGRLCPEHHRAVPAGEMDKSIYYTKSNECIMCKRRKNKIKQFKGK